ncbi:MAG: serine hydrolase [Bifidobacteriaceae bacterium]|jgi:dipeptidyl aminopeptidase/acylaminoacyl peptidase/CubicO group peptidase (beta-lactamase class C family)|nr:serine hydrolase [Bifidobacteriaceae bacterium]
MTRRLSVRDLAAITSPAQAALSPDGARIVYAVRGVDLEADRATSSLWLAEVGAAPRRLTLGPNDSAPVFSPDGSTLAFLREGQLWTLPAGAGEPQQRTFLPLGAGEAVFCPDGGRIAFSARTDGQADPGEDQDARARRVSRPIVVDGLGYQADGVGLLRGVRLQIHVLDLATGAVAQLTDADAHATSPTWSPDGGQIAFVRRPDDEDDLGFRSAVHVLEADDPLGPPELVAFADGVALTVAYAPDGSLLVVGWDQPRPVGIANLYRVDAATGAATRLAASLDRNVSPGATGYPGAAPKVSDAGEVVFAVRDRGCSHLYAVPLTGGEPRPVLAGAGREVAGLSLAGGTAATVVTTATSFGDVVRVDLATGAETMVAAHGSAPDGAELYIREPRQFEIGDGTAVEGWVLRDPAAAGPTPLLLDIHGGPHNAWNGAVDAAHLYHQELVRRGWTVLTVNPRGSDGYGDGFYRAVDGRWGEADLSDFLEPVDRLVAEGLADPARLAVAGYSYGGFMTCRLTSLDNRFAAAIAGGLICDFASLAGTGDLGHLSSLVDWKAMAWLGQDQRRVAELSPYSAVDRVDTATLILHGGEDRRCPLGQAQQWHHALREQGVPTRLVVYPGASHLFILEGRPSHRVDVGERLVEWAERHAGAASGPRPAPIDAAHWRRRLDALVGRHKVAGAALGLTRLGPDGYVDVATAASGTLNRRLGARAAVGEDSLFQIGSITKVWTASAIMRLIDQGRLTLDSRVKDLLPDFKLADREATERLTVWHLLTHTSGIDGDIFTDTGRGDEAVREYVGRLDSAARIHPLGATWSYCNAGFVVLGRIIEELTGQTWDAAMRAALFEPLGLTRTTTLPEETVMFSAAVGHIDIAGDIQVAPAFLLPRSMAPAGLITSSVADVLAFARLHLRGGVTDDGSRVISADSAERMAAAQFATTPADRPAADSMGLGWLRADWNGERMLWHNGGTIGQFSWLCCHPASGVAAVLVTNGGADPDGLADQLLREVFATLAGVDKPAPTRLPDKPADADIAPFAGTYENGGTRFEVFEGETGPRLRATALGPLAALSVPNPTEYPMVPLDSDLWAVPMREDGGGPVRKLFFFTLADGRQYLQFGRTAPKISDRVAAGPLGLAGQGAQTSAGLGDGRAGHQDQPELRRDQAGGPGQQGAPEGGR